MSTDELLSPGGAQLRGRLTCTVPEAGALLGIGRDAAYAAAHRGEIPTLTYGRRLVVPVRKLLEQLGCTEESEDRAPTRSTATTDEASEGPRHENNPTLHLI